MPHASKASRVERRSDVDKPPYANPPVHEVILDVQFHRSIDENVLRDLRPRLESVFKDVDLMNLMQLEMGIGPGGPGYQNTLRKFGGWQFKKEGWVLQTGPTSLTLHNVRPGQQWPKGSYVGWRVIYPFFLELHAALQDVYGTQDIKRAGLRYLNRIAIPKGGDVGEWLAFKVEAPKLLHDLYTFNVRHIWARAGEDEDISATIGLAKIEVSDAALAEENDGVLLDIDMFNLWIERAPSYAALPDWFQRAHATENDVFEGCLTDAIRERFNTP